MCLPRDEREILAFYYRSNPNGSSSYSADDLKDLDLLIRFSHRKKLAEDPSIRVQTIEQVNIALRNRGLLRYDINSSPGRMRIDLTPEGMRLGRIYNSLPLTVLLCFTEWRVGHIISFLRGIMGR
jgi:hypothetical protein